jgi:hypothetical protein
MALTKKRPENLLLQGWHFDAVFARAHGKESPESRAVAKHSTAQ